MNSKNVQNPKPDEKVCFNCKFLIWSIGIGRGIRCSARDGFRMPSFKSYTCDNFQYETLPEKKRE
jgi:hypothetical protein